MLSDEHVCPSWHITPGWLLISGVQPQCFDFSWGGMQVPWQHEDFSSMSPACSQCLSSKHSTQRWCFKEHTRGAAQSRDCLHELFFSPQDTRPATVVKTAAAMIRRAELNGDPTDITRSNTYYNRIRAAQVHNRRITTRNVPCIQNEI